MVTIRLQSSELTPGTFLRVAEAAGWTEKKGDVGAAVASSMREGKRHCNERLQRTEDAFIKIAHGVTM